MSAPVETTAAMTAPGDATAAVTAESAAPEPQRSMPPAGSARLEGLPAGRIERRSVSPNVVISVMGGLIAALLVWQFGALGNSIDSLSARIDSQGAELRAEMDTLRTDLSTRIDNQGAELRAEMDTLRTDLRSEIRGEIGMLRAEMQAGFRSINETLLDHTDRLARLEAAMADPAPGS
ncbi:MAG: hypothetical protein F4169_04335 [Gammaproteobacteria bacterium]|nr:hypothetical protein [Gammaproteobacteria bacterium]